MVLPHGLGADRRVGWPQTSGFADAGYHVLVSDPLDHGRSSKVETLRLRDLENRP